MNIALVVGHDSDRMGAVGSEGISEFDFNHTFLLNLPFDTAPERHNLYIFYRSADISGYSAKMRDLHERIDRLGCEISIEFHFNATVNQTVNGHEVLFCSQGGKRISSIINQELDIMLPTRNRGIKRVSRHDRGGGFCCRGKSLAVIIEPFFASEQSRFIYDGDLRDRYYLALKRVFERL